MELQQSQVDYVVQCWIVDNCAAHPRRIDCLKNITIKILLPNATAWFNYSMHTYDNEYNHILHEIEENVLTASSTVIEVTLLQAVQLYV